MNSTQTRNGTTRNVGCAQTVVMKLEVVVIPVSDVDRVRRFYADLGWRLGVDIANDDSSGWCISRLRGRNARFSSERVFPRRRQTRHGDCTSSSPLERQREERSFNAG